MDTPLISVLMPIFNAELFLREAIESIVGQTERRWELLCLDDGSSDNSRRVVNDWAALDERIIAVELPHQGISKTLQAGLAIGRGKFVARMDSDDISYPRRFEAQIRHLEENPDCVLVGTAYDFLTDGKLMPGYELPRRRTYVPGHREGVFVCTPTNMMRAEAARRVGYREQFEFAEDSDFLQRILRFGAIDNLSEVLLAYRRHPAQISSTRADIQSLRNGVAVTLGAELEPPTKLPDGPLDVLAVAKLAAASAPLLCARLQLELADFHSRTVPATRASTDNVLAHLRTAARRSLHAAREPRAHEVHRHAQLALVASGRRGDALVLAMRAATMDPLFFCRRVAGYLARRVLGPFGHSSANAVPTSR